MITRQAAPVAGAREGTAPASRIVRIAGVAWPLMAAALVLGTVAVAVSHQAWLPLAAGRASAAAWDTRPGWPLDWLAEWQIAVATRVMASNTVAGAIAVAAVCAASATAGLAITVRATGLGASLAALVALVAAAAPLAGGSASSPLGAAPASLLGLALLAVVVRHESAKPARSGVLAALLLPLLALGEVVSRALQASSSGTTLAWLRGDLGLPGLVLLVASLDRARRGTATTRVWCVAGTVWLASTPCAAEVRAALLLPSLWWLTGSGLAHVVAWRGREATRWATAGLLIWIALHVAARPWGHEWQQAALVGSWAQGLAPAIDVSRPLVREASANGRLLAARVATPASGVMARVPVIEARDAPASMRAGRAPVVVSAASLDALRWGGLAFGPRKDSAGTSLERLLDDLPGGTITLAAVSVEAAARLTPRQWQALGRVGLRLPDAATPRAHALVGITGARVDVLESARPGATRLDVQPGALLGRTAARSPIDARLDAGASRVSIWLRGQPLIDDVDGLAVALFSTRGDLLAWRAGGDPAHLVGSALGPSPAIDARGIAALPCLDVEPGGERDLTPVSGTGAIGLAWSGRLRLSAAVERPRHLPGGGVRLAAAGATAGLPTLAEAEDSPDSFTVQAAGSGATGVYLRGPIARVVARTDHRLRACAAWPMALALGADQRPLEMQVSPRDEGHFQGGWHDSEVQPGGGYFRWMAGPLANLVVTLSTPLPFSFALDGQAPGMPVAGDQVRLAVNGHDLGPRPLLPTRGIYAWEVPAEAVRAGLNTITVTTSRTVRPADLRPGADARQLGLLVRAWTVSPAS